MPETSLLYSRCGFKKSRIIIFLIVLLHFYPFNIIYGQEDTVKRKKTVDPAKLDSAYHSPRKAALFSAVIPGLGQIYNKRIWKVPIIYGGFVGMGFLIDWNNDRYRLWREAYIDYEHYREILEVTWDMSKEQVKMGKDFYKRQKELSIILTAGFYLLQVIDATVDAYLFDWSVGEDLSLKLDPVITPVPSGTFNSYENTFGLRACLSF